MGAFKLSVQGTLHVSRQTVLDPDFMLLRPREQGYKLSLPTPPDGALLIEVAGSSIGRDTKAKKPIYAEHGIADYWVADLDREHLIVFRQLAEGVYAEPEILGLDATIAPSAAPQFKVTVRDIFN